MTTETATVSAVEVVASTRRREGLFALVREALAGTRHDFTKLPVRRAILLLAIPMVDERLFTFSSTTDECCTGPTFCVGKAGSST